jgi:DNA polymerase III epsilon subunit-like protein
LNLKKLDDKAFNECLEAKIKSQGKIPFWEQKFKKFANEGYDIKDREDLRDKFRKWCKKRGITINFENENSNTNVEVRQSPRVAVCDIETLPIIMMGWSLWDQNISLDQIVADGCILSWAGKMLNESEMYSDILTSKEAKARDTSRITKSIWDFLSGAQVVIGHNFSQFDVKYINTEFLKHGLPPLKFNIVDTLMVAKQNFRFSSNKMKFLNDQLNIRNKEENSGFPLWRGCSDGDEESLKTMIHYNIQDIGATEELFYKVRPYVRNFNVALYNELDAEQCPVCGSTNLKNEGEYFTSAGKWQSVRCQDCKCISRRKTNLLSKEKKKSLLVNS